MIINLIYPANIEREGDAYNITFNDFPEIATWAQNRDEIMDVARDAIETALAGRINRKEEIPLPEKRKPNIDPLIPAPILIAAKATLYYLMKIHGMSNSELARKLKKDEKVVRRLLNPKDKSKIESIEQAIIILGARSNLSFDIIESDGPEINAKMVNKHRGIYPS